LFFSQVACTGLYLKIISPFSSPPNSHGSIITMSPGLTHSFLFSLPGILQFLVFPSRHFTSHLDAPSLASSMPSTSFPLGSLTLKSSCSWSSYFCFIVFLKSTGLFINFFCCFFYSFFICCFFSKNFICFFIMF